MTIFDRLPDEVIHLIIGNVVHPSDLYACTLVNKLFYDMANPLLWQSLDMEMEPSFARCISSLVRASESPPAARPLNNNVLGHHIHKLTIHEFLTDTSFMLLLPHIPCLDELVLFRATRITDTSFQHLAHYCPKLQKLQLWRSPISAPTFTKACQQLPQLRTLQILGSFHSISPRLFRSLRHLEHVWTQPSDWMTQDTILDLHRMDGLKSLWLHFLPVTMPYQLLTTPTLLWPHLTSLRLGSHLDDRTMIHLIKTHPQLNELAMSGKKFSDLSLGAIGIFLSGTIQSVQLFDNDRITRAGIYRLVQQCGQQLGSLSVQESAVLAQGFPELGIPPRRRRHLSYRLLDHVALNQLRRVLAAQQQQQQQ